MEIGRGRVPMITVTLVYRVQNDMTIFDQINTFDYQFIHWLHSPFCYSILLLTCLHFTNG